MFKSSHLAYEFLIFSSQYQDQTEDSNLLVLMEVPCSFVAEILGWPKPFGNIKLLDQTVSQCLCVTEGSFLYKQVLQESNTNNTVTKSSLHWGFSV